MPAKDNNLDYRNQRASLNNMTTVPRRTILIYLLAALEGMVFGYDTGVVAGALLFLKKDMALTAAMQGLIVSALLFGSLISGFTTGILSSRLGAKKVISLAGLLFLIGSLGCALAPNTEVLIVFRFILGLAVGAGTVQVPMYLAELSPAQSRGKLTSLYQLMIAIGIFLAYIAGYTLAESGNWRLMFGLAAIPAIILMVGVWFLPESPRWLAKRGRNDEAKAILLNTRSREEAEKEYKKLWDVSSQLQRPSWQSVLQNRWITKVLLLVICMCLLQQLLGINTIVYYTPTILQSAGFTPAAAILTGVVLQLVSIIMTFILGRIVDKTGRKIMLGIGAFCMALSMSLLGVVFHFHFIEQQSGAALSIACLAFFKIAFSLSWGPILWIVIPEILPLQIRSLVMGFCVSCVYIANFAVSFSFPILLASGPSYAFGTFACFGFLAVILVWRWLPETAGRTLEEIEQDGNRSKNVNVPAVTEIRE